MVLFPLYTLSPNDAMLSNESSADTVTLNAAPAVCVPGVVIAYFVAAAGCAVTVKSTFDKPELDARAVLLFEPAVVPTVQLLTVANPLLLVDCEPPVTLPPPSITAKVTL